MGNWPLALATVDCRISGPQQFAAPPGDSWLRARKMQNAADNPVRRDARRWSPICSIPTPEIFMKRTLLAISVAVAANASGCANLERSRDLAIRRCHPR